MNRYLADNLCLRTHYKCEICIAKLPIVRFARSPDFVVNSTMFIVFLKHLVVEDLDIVE